MFIVLSTLVVTSIIAKGPVIFLKLSEDDYGEIDAFIFPVGSYETPYPPMETNFINHTRVVEVLKNQSAQEFNISPRKVFSGVFFDKQAGENKKLDMKALRERYERRKGLKKAARDQ